MIQTRSGPLLVLFLALLLALAVGCSDDPKPGVPSPQPDADAGMEPDPNPDPEPDECTTSADCDSAADTEGRVCVDGACVACTDNDTCIGDPAYGADRSLCDNGRCGTCDPGLVGCDCLDDDSCTFGECVGGTCADCRRGDEGCICRLNGTCGENLVCADGLCAPCTPGLEGCPCDEGACGEGLVCEGEVCVTDPCTPGALDCPCGEDDACDAGDEAYCDDMGVCRACSSDVEGCPCDPGDTCEGDNFCLDGVCGGCPETDRPEDCRCGESEDCAEDLACDDDTLLCRPSLDCETLCIPNQLCDDTLPGDAFCVPESCIDGFDFENGECVPGVIESCDGREGTVDISADCAADGRACLEQIGGAICVLTCVEIGQTCADQNRDCDRNEGPQDAVCGDCAPGSIEQDGACVANAQANCVPDALDTILEACTGRLQECVTLDEGGAECGECLAGTVFDPVLSACVVQPLCSDRVCTAEEFCAFPQNGAPPRCTERPCPNGQVFNTDTEQCVSCNAQCGGRATWPELVDGACVCEDEVFCDFQFDGTGDRCRTSDCAPGQAATPGDQCVDCFIECGDALGETPRLWPETTLDGSCICETQTTFYLPIGGANTPERCDADSDGWVNRKAKRTFEIPDPAVLSNFRCELRSIDRVSLENEYGQRRFISMCNGELEAYGPGEEPSCGQDRVVLILSEADVLDSNNSITLDDAAFPVYGNEGRKLTANELNPLTKACVNVGADFNLNGRADISEEQPLTNSRIEGLNFDDTEDFFFQSFAYFVELHTGFYEPGQSFGLPGRYVIKERSRCDETSTMGYFTGNGYDKQCTRNRRSDFDFGGNLVGADFGLWGCDSVTGSCPLPNPPLDDPIDDENGDRIPDHGLCELSRTLENEPWRGMNHHSQYQCAVIKNLPVPDNPWEVDRTLLHPTEGGARFTFNACQASACPEDEPDCVETRPTGAVQPGDPNVQCEPKLREDVVGEVVGFVAARYIPDEAYQRGCIDEANFINDPGWDFLCPGFDVNPDGILAAGNPGDLGNLICSCNRFFGGNKCEVACAQRPEVGGPISLHVGGRDVGYDNEQIAQFACGADDFFCQLHPPLPEEGFIGGRRGYWMCGDFTVTRPAVGDNPFMETEGDGEPQYQLRGGIRKTPVQRILLEEAECDPETESCYSIF